MTTKQTCELLLPVGNLKMCHAAIHNGADAIYVGVPEFNARGRSADHSINELKEIIELCHLYGVRVNLAFNVLIFEDELLEVRKLLSEVLPLNPDAIIVQDIGLIKIIKAMAPAQKIHASTQMTVTNFEAMELLSDLDIKRFVLGREVSIPEMKLIREKTDRELEVFVHGALCVAYSGQCFTSESIGGRSANRGQCAQSCRFEYELIVDGKAKNLIDEKYLVSPKDLCGIAQIPELLDLKINSLKVEGRLKTPEYVAAAGSEYRKAIDFYFKNKEFKAVDVENAKKKMGLTFSRGFFSGWLNGVDHQNLVDGTFSSHRGVLIGSVLIVNKNFVVIETKENLKNGDGILLASIHIKEKLEIGGKLIEVSRVKEGLKLVFHKNVDLSKVKKGFEVYLNSKTEVIHELTKSYEDKNLKKKISLKVEVSLANKRLRVIASDLDGNSAEIISDHEIEKAHQNPTTANDIKTELSALSATIYKLARFEYQMEEIYFIHQKELKEMRRKFVEILNQKRVSRNPVQLQPLEFNWQPKKVSANPKLNIVLRSIEQVENFITFASIVRDVINVVILDFEFGVDYKPSVMMLKDAKIKVGIATTRILKPKEYYNFKIIDLANPDVILIRNLGALYYFNTNFPGKYELVGDFSLNASNSYTYDYLLTKNLTSVCASYDINFDRLEKLLMHTDPSKVEVTIHQYMPSFHMEHCVFAAFLSKGHSYRDCGKPCEKHHVELKDQFGNFHFIKADQECRNTMFNAIPQSAAKKIKTLRNHGVSFYRFEALDENREDLEFKINLYADLLRTNSDEEDLELFKKIKTIEKYGMGEGTFVMKDDYKDRKKEKLR